MEEIIEQIKQISGVDEIFTAGESTIIVTLKIEQNAEVHESIF